MCRRIFIFYLCCTILLILVFFLIISVPSELRLISRVPFFSLFSIFFSQLKSINFLIHKVGALKNELYRHSVGYFEILRPFNFLDNFLISPAPTLNFFLFFYA